MSTTDADEPLTTASGASRGGAVGSCSASLGYWPANQAIVWAVGDAGGDGDRLSAERRVRDWEPALSDASAAGLVRDLTRSARPVDESDAAALLAAVSGLAFWAAETGWSVSAAVLTDPLVIRRYVAGGMDGLSPSWRRQVLNMLVRTAGAWTGTEIGPVPRESLSKQRGLPYAPSQVDALLRWAQGQRSDLKRHSYLVVLAGGLGAGLGNADLHAVRGRDVTVAADGSVRVEVPGPGARQVTVLQRYEDLLARLAGVAGDDGWLIAPWRTPGNHKYVSATLADGQADATVPALSTTRCRATWIATHLVAGTRLDVLAVAAGIDVDSLVAQHARLLPPQGLAEARQALRSATHPLSVADRTGSRWSPARRPTCATSPRTSHRASPRSSRRPCTATRRSVTGRPPTSTRRSARGHDLPANGRGSPRMQATTTASRAPVAARTSTSASFPPASEISGSFIPGNRRPAGLSCPGPWCRHGGRCHAPFGPG